MLKTFSLAEIAGKAIVPFGFGSHSSEVALWFAGWQAGTHDGIAAFNSAQRAALKRAFRNATGEPFRTREGVAKPRKDGTLGKVPTLKLTPNTAEADADMLTLAIAIDQIADMPTDDGYKVLRLRSTTEADTGADKLAHDAADDVVPEADTL